MYLENISLRHFKNYLQCDLEFSQYINCIMGPNGSGKTNLLDAIHYLSLTKSSINPIDQQNIQHDEEFFSIRGTFYLHGKNHQIQCSCKIGSKKVIRKDKKPYTRLSEHIGAFPLVLISPYDTDILREGSMTRRKFMDGIISQIDPQYLRNLLKYQRLLSQRNQLLKNFALKHQYDAQLIASYDEPMLQLMKLIFDRRNQFLDQYVPLFKKHYNSLSEGSEEVDLNYKSDLFAADFIEKFQNNHQRDLTLQRTDLGTHKDDLSCRVSGYSIRKFGSQGQQKSFVIALKLAQFELIQKEKEFKPILLLDDIFDKLDDKRIEQLINMVSGQTFGQLFITDARPERTARILEKVPCEISKFMVDNGKVAAI